MTQLGTIRPTIGLESDGEVVGPDNPLPTELTGEVYLAKMDEMIKLMKISHQYLECISGEKFTELDIEE